MGDGNSGIRPPKDLKDFPKASAGTLSEKPRINNVCLNVEN
jgi:hypothetical protein